MSRTPVVTTLLALSLCALLTSCSRPANSGAAADVQSSPREPNPPPGHRQMLTLLKELRGRANEEHPFMEDRSLKEARGELAQFPETGAANERFPVLLRVGFHALRLGQTRESIAALEEAQRISVEVQPPIDEKVRQSLLLQLGVAWLRHGEIANCIQCQTAESCLFPIRGAGVHQQTEGSQQARRVFLQLLKANPDHLMARWLLNIAAMTLGEYPAGVPNPYLIPESSFGDPRSFPEFNNVAAAVGLNSVALCGGAICDDFDQDGLLDVITTTWGLDGQMQFRRNRGDGTFEDVTEQAGLTGIVSGLNMISGDYDSDGDLDILILRGAWLRKFGAHPNSLLQNQGDGTFIDVTFDAGLGAIQRPTGTAAWGDYDRDGDLDLYIGNEQHPSELYRNEGDGQFTDVALSAGVDNGLFTKAVAFGDVNEDNWLDIYASNLDGPNCLYINTGQGTFQNQAAQAGVERPIKSFPAWFFDFNNDGHLDLFSASYTATSYHIAADYLGLPHDDEPDRIYRGDGRGQFQDATQELGFTRVTQPMGSNFGDFDHDGYPDLYLGTGDPLYENLMPNLVFHNREGRRFEDVTIASRMGHLQKGHGVSFADLDNDGDEDLFIEMGGAFPGDTASSALFENPGFETHQVTLQVIGRVSPRSAFHCRVHAVVREDNKPRDIYRWVDTGGSFGCNPLRLQIGVGAATVIERLDVLWPTTGKTQSFEQVAVDRYYAVREEDQRLITLPWRTVPFHKRSHHADVAKSPLP